jgi:carbon storage regulator
MLILSRREGEKIRIGEDIEILVTRIEAGVVKLGVIAPREMAVFRQEIFRRVKESNLDAVRGGEQALPPLSLPPEKQPAPTGEAAQIPDPDPSAGDRKRER